jgi:hypothetical protein
MLLETVISDLWSYGARSNADKCGFDRRWVDPMIMKSKRGIQISEQQLVGS